MTDDQLLDLYFEAEDTYWQAAPIGEYPAIEMQRAGLRAVYEAGLKDATEPHK